MPPFRRGERSAKAQQLDALVYVSAVTIGELRRGVEKFRHRGDAARAVMLEAWLVSAGQGLALATRNVAHFAGIGVRLCNPFLAAPTP